MNKQIITSILFVAMAFALVFGYKTMTDPIVEDNSEIFHIVLEKKLKQFHKACNRYPTSEEGIKVFFPKFKNFSFCDKYKEYGFQQIFIDSLKEDFSLNVSQFIKLVEYRKDGNSYHLKIKKED